MDVSIIGSGIVGTATGKGLAKLGHSVIFNDTNAEKLRRLSFEGYQTTRDLSEAVTSTSISFICVQTPAPNGVFDLGIIGKSIVSVTGAMLKKKDHHLIVVRSTLLPGTCRNVLIPLLESHNRAAFADYGFCYNPEFLREKTALEDFLKPDRIVIGAQDPQSGDLLQELYLDLGAPIIRTDFDTAELIKLVSNAFLATKISFFNEVDLLCQKLKINSTLVSEAVSLDPRIGKYGIYGGKPFSGSCLVKDVEALTRFIKDLGLHPDILERVIAVNGCVKTDVRPCLASDEQFDKTLKKQYLEIQRQHHGI